MNTLGTTVNQFFEKMLTRPETTPATYIPAPVIAPTARPTPDPALEFAAATAPITSGAPFANAKKVTP